MTKNKALLIIILVAIAVLLALAIFYFYFMRGTEPYQPVTPDGTTFPIGPDIDGGGGGGSTSTSSPSYEYQYYNRPETFEDNKQKLRLISSLPVSGATLFNRNTETYIHYVERANGHIYEATASENKPPYRISKTTIPQIYEAYWTQGGQGVIIRYLKENQIQTFYARIKTGSATSTEQDLVDGVFLPSNISTLSVSEDGGRIFYLVDGVIETLGHRANPNNSSRVTLFNSQAREWLTTWAGNNNLILTTKPSASVEGAAYGVNAGNGDTRKIIGNIKGLTTLPNHDLSEILYSQTSPSGVLLKTLVLANGTVNDVGVNTLPEKCTWSKKESRVVFCAVPDHIPSGKYPDAWYQGIVSFADNIWKINLKTGEAIILLSPQVIAKQTMDITNLVLDESEKYILFTNKKDLSLWLLELE